MYKNILIISDNSRLCKELAVIFDDYKGENLSVSFSVSPFTDQDVFCRYLERNVLVYDLRNDKDVEEIIGTYDLIFSIHCKQIFPAKLVRSVKCINIHHGYNPINRGWYPQVFAIIRDLPVGATIHEMDEELDNGSIIARCFVEKSVTDTSEVLYDRILRAEIQLFKTHIDSIINNTYTTIVPETKGSLNLKKDFRELCRLDLDEELTMLQCINRLRALTHGKFKNAYFIDPETQKKVFVSINIEAEQ